MLKLESQSQDAYKTHQQLLTLVRKDAKKYQQLLSPQDLLYQEINRILITHQSGIHQLSTGQKINATKITLRGGGKEHVPSAIVVKVSSERKEFRKYYQAPQGKRIVGRDEPRIEGAREDIGRIEWSISEIQGNITEKDLNDWERGGEGEFKANVGGMIPAVDIGARGAAHAKDQKEHEETYSNPTVILEVKAKKPGFFQSMKPVTISIDVWVEDIPEKKELLPLDLSSEIIGSTAALSISSRLGSTPVLLETVERIRTLRSQVKDSNAKEGSIDSEVNVPRVLTGEQMTREGTIHVLRQEIDSIDIRIDKLEAKRKEAVTSYKNEEDAYLKDMYLEDIKKLRQDLEDLRTAQKKLQTVLYSILEKSGGEEEKK